MPSQETSPPVEAFGRSESRSSEKDAVLDREVINEMPYVNCLPPQGVEGGDSSHDKTTTSLDLQQPFYLTQFSSANSQSHTESESKSKSKSKTRKSSHHSTKSHRGDTHQPTGVKPSTNSNKSHAIITATQYHRLVASPYPLLSSNSSLSCKHKSTLKPKPKSHKTKKSTKSSKKKGKVTATITKTKTKQEIITKWYSATPTSSLAAVSQTTVTSCGVTPYVSLSSYERQLGDHRRRALGKNTIHPSEPQSSPSRSDPLLLPASSKFLPPSLPPSLAIKIQLQLPYIHPLPNQQLEANQQCPVQ
ncbi:hypothetical protein BJ875DRAFT_543859 [Amylocarpus encephaloides]|uniref:Uncharacterized protein n=1 Tax=Amylocarpus encephaloides TaxID=45428 RepID=A0A9P7YHX3_9HELO|nr:hypothetical protein BJ875DRAFT_543859 [Amylocarpus encephaloides]